MKEYNVLPFAHMDEFMETFKSFADEGWIFESFFPPGSTRYAPFAALISFDQEAEEIGSVFTGMAQAINTLIGHADEDGPVECTCYIGPTGCAIHPRDEFGNARNS